MEAMQSPEATKTYLALCDGDGTWNGVDYMKKGWFTFDNPVNDEWGKPCCIFFITLIIIKTIDFVNREENGRL